MRIYIYVLSLTPLPSLSYILRHIYLSHYLSYSHTQLSDEPGLGKTVTMLAVVLQSQGVKSQVPATLPKSPDMRRLRTQTFEKRLEILASTTCQATLIVVPDTLIGHWEAQINTHTRIGSSGCRGRIFIDKNKRLPLPEPDELAAMSIVVTTHR